jgi:FKBP-type peptidyl-prolyl cis-trans isomerase
MDALTEGFSMMKEGGEAILCFTSELGYGSAGATLMKDVPAYQSMKYELQLLEVIGDIEAYEDQRILSYVDTIAGVDTIYDAYTETVMYYVLDSIVESGNPVVNDSVVEIAYKGYLVDGRVFDESDEDSPYSFTVGDYDASTSPISGWHLGVARFKEGEKGRLIIPYELAYGEDGSVTSNQVSIPPYETLVFDIEVVSVSADDDDDTGDDE